MRVPAAIILFIVGVALVAAGWMAPGAPRVNIRWTPQTSERARLEAERSLHLAGALPRGGRTWSYLVLDTSRDNVGRILDHPAVEDRHYIGPGRTLTPEAPPVQAWFQARYGRPPVNWIAASWGIAGPALCAIALVMTWRQLRRLAAASDLRIAVILVASAGLRLWLVISGGQYYWPDEKQYRGAQRFIASLLERRPGSWHELIDAPSALMLKLVGAMPAAIERLVGESPHIPALFYASCSLISIWLVAAIARRLDASRDEAFIATLLAAGSTALFYMSRHLVSYDLALLFGLIGLFVGVNRARGRQGSMVTGAWAALTFLAYAGAWPLAGALCAVHVADAPGVGHALRRAGRVVVGIGALLAALAIGYRLTGISWIERLSAFAGTITQGDFREGWTLPLEYLWHAEHWLFVGWMLGLGSCVVHLSSCIHNRLARAGLVGAACVYVALAIASTGLHRFVVYGRLSRPLVPFLCLVTAAAIGRVMSRQVTSRWSHATALAAFVAAVVGQATVNFRVPLQQEFPTEFIARVERQYPAPRVFVNAHHMYPGPVPEPVPAGYVEIASAHHPLEFVPYQYEGFTADERQVLRTADLRMRAFIPQR